MPKYLLCCDLDRTVLPNGYAHESPGVRDIFARIVQEANLTLAYVSGRNLDLLQQAIAEYNIPTPDYAVGDVGTTIYTVQAGHWQSHTGWSEEIGKDWQQHDSQTLRDYLEEIKELVPQAAEHQNEHKLSYDVTLDLSEKSLLSRINKVLEKHRIRANIIYSIDEIEQIGLIDILPQSASKYHAIEFLCQQLDISKQHTLFAGDSGNDLPVLTSDIPAVLVNNAGAGIKKTARQLADRAGHAQKLYLARGGFYGLNGNYCAGILEGLAHFYPQFRTLIASMTRTAR